MPKRSNQFQRLVLLINSALAGNARVVESAMVRDKITGDEREVDVLITTESCGYDVNIAVEVVSRSRKADTPWVESMYAKHTALPTDKLILVAERGFTTTALEKAKFLGIEAVTIETALAADWQLVTRLSARGFIELTSFKYLCKVVYVDEDGTRQQLDIPSSSYITIDSKQMLLDEIVPYILSLPEIKNTIYPRIRSMNERQFWFSFSKPDALSAEIEGRKINVVELRVGLDVDHARTPVEISSGKYRDTPFVSGVSASPPSELQFVIVKKTDGTSEALITDVFGTRRFTSDCDESAEH